MNDQPGMDPTHDAPEGADGAAQITPPDAPSADLTASEDAAGVKAPPSVLESLRQAYAEADSERRTVLMIVPGRFNSALAARYKPIPWTEQRKRIRAMAKRGESEETELNYGAGIIAEACEEILVRAEDGGELVPLHEAAAEFAEEPVRYDARLCRLLGIEGGEELRGPAICRLVFRNPQALNAHFAELEAWLREGTVDDGDEDGEGVRPT